MAARFGIDTPILVRPVTGDPEDDFEGCVRKLTSLIERDEASCGLLEPKLAETQET